MSIKLEDTGQDSIELAYEIPSPGISVVQFVEGITKRTNENTGKTTLQLPMLIDRVIEGPEENSGKKLSHFVPIETEWGEKQIAGILSMTGLINKFSEKFGEEIEATDDRFVNAIKLKLPGKFVAVHHDTRKDQKGNDQTTVIKFEKHGTAKPVAAKSESDKTADDW
jgi:hypothetical protein